MTGRDAEFVDALRECLGLAPIGGDPNYQCVDPITRFGRTYSLDTGMTRRRKGAL